MKYVALLCLAFSSCASRVYYPNGRIAHADYTDFDGTTEIKTKSFYYKRTGRQDASTPTRTAVDGIAKGLLMLGAGGAAIP